MFYSHITHQRNPITHTETPSGGFFFHLSAEIDCRRRFRTWQNFATLARYGKLGKRNEKKRRRARRARRARREIETSKKKPQTTRAPHALPLVKLASQPPVPQMAPKRSICEVMISNLDDETPDIDPKVPASYFGPFASKVLDAFIDEAPPDVLRMIENIHRRDFIDNIVKARYNTAHDTVFIAQIDFNEYVADTEYYMTEQVIRSIDAHNNFEQVTRNAINEVFFTTNSIMTDMAKHKNTALPQYADLCKMQADCITRFRAVIEASANSIIDSERE